MRVMRSCCWLATVLIAALATASALMAQSENQSLGEYARTARKGKSGSSAAAPRVYDNDNLPIEGAVSVVGHPGSDSSSSESESDDKDQGRKQNHDQEQAQDKDKDKDKDQSQDKAGPAKTESKPPAKEAKPAEPELQPGQSAEEREKALQVWKEKISGQKEKIDLVSRELDVLKGEYRLKAAEFYADTARRVQNPYGFTADDAKYKQRIADKEKELDDAKAKLADIQGEARRLGAPSSVTE
jgi:hypothetical protein